MPISAPTNVTSRSWVSQRRPVLYLVPRVLQKKGKKRKRKKKRLKSIFRAETLCQPASTHQLAPFLFAGEPLETVSAPSLPCTLRWWRSSAASLAATSRSSPQGDEDHFSLARHSTFALHVVPRAAWRGNAHSGVRPACPPASRWHSQSLRESHRGGHPCFLRRPPARPRRHLSLPGRITD